MILPDQDQGDEDSLFGSPPPSPRGRSTSPALALPCAVNSLRGNALHNVGTIALPGSHPYSKLPVNTLASSSSLTTPRPPAPRATAPYSQADVSYPHEGGRFTEFYQTTKYKRKSSKAKVSTSRLPAPEIMLPDPHEPLPPHFLRNQTALLGTAGLVGGIKPSNLSVQRLMRGTTSTNPIVVEDEATPMLGKGTQFRQEYVKAIDPSLLPAPTNQDIVSVLIRQKEIFPVLESILKLIASQTGASTPATSQGFRRPAPFQVQRRKSLTPEPAGSSSNAASRYKRRKLSSVPAGAVDWDVPYPFAKGEGPDAYRTTWEHQRGKQLISQLVTLIKAAAHKAATKTYLRNEMNRKTLEQQKRASTSFNEAQWREQTREFENVGQSFGHRYRHYRPTSVAYGVEREEAVKAVEQASAAAAGNSNLKGETINSVADMPMPMQLPIHSNPPATINHAQSPSTATPFDQLINSLLAASPVQPLGSASAPYARYASHHQTADPEPTASTATTASATVASGNMDGAGEGVDSALFDSWMSVLQSFPMPLEGFAPPQMHKTFEFSGTATPTSSVDDMGFFGDGKGDGDFNFNFGTEVDTDVLENLQSKPTSTPICAAPQSKVYAPLHGSDTDYLIHPDLLAMSLVPESISLASLSTSITTPSPAPSTNGAAAPSTPSSVAWDNCSADVYSDDGFSGNGFLDVNCRIETGVERQKEKLFSLVKEIHGIEKVKQSPEPLSELCAGIVTRDISSVVTGTVDQIEERKENDLLRKNNVEEMHGDVNTGYTGDVGLNKGRSSRTGFGSDRQALVTQAKEKRKLLTEELANVKIQLWEATIEGGALAHVAQFR